MPGFESYFCCFLAVRHRESLLYPQKLEDNNNSCLKESLWGVNEPVMCCSQSSSCYADICHLASLYYMPDFMLTSFIHVIFSTIT